MTINFPPFTDVIDSERRNHDRRLSARLRFAGESSQSVRGSRGGKGRWEPGSPALQSLRELLASLAAAAARDLKKMNTQT